MNLADRIANQILDLEVERNLLDGVIEKLRDALREHDEAEEAQEVAEEPAEPAPGKPSAPAASANGQEAAGTGTGWKWEGKVRELLLAGPKRTGDIGEKFGIDQACLQPTGKHPWFTKDSRFAPWQLTDAGRVAATPES